ncbi:MAG: PA2169 family four-helix-bundle protein [Planctomycetota bacterium]|nr:PA2169 family four-helix-bundle protein [Planctomycetota bacterium]
MPDPTTRLERKTIDKVNDLVSINVDSAKGFKEAADAVKDDRFANMFREAAEQRRGFANDLAGYIQHEMKPDSDGSAKAKIHRWWLDVRAKLSDGDTHTVLEEAERGEDQIKGLYEKVLKETAGSPLNDVLQRQYAAVKKTHDRVRDLRDATKAA